MKAVNISEERMGFTMNIRILTISPTVFLKTINGELKQLIRITFWNGQEAAKGNLSVHVGREHLIYPLSDIKQGECVQEVFIPLLKEKTKVVFLLAINDSVADRKEICMDPPRKWVVHVVQLSHHDAGYTDLPSRVLKEHYEMLDKAIDMAESTEDFPDDAKFRIVIEQAWSIDRFIKNAPDSRKAKMIELLRSGRFELTALFGNMTTEICGHEVLARSVYHAFGLQRKYGIPIVSAEHNDITGISRGLSQVLTEAGIKIFCPGIPNYYDWGSMKLQSIWDQKRIFGHEGPGAFWWEAPSGKRVLFWCNNSGNGGDVRASMPDLAGRLWELSASDYPYSVIRWPVTSGARDNAPYIEGYAQKIKEWNEKWDYPHLICSTNAKFYEDIKNRLTEDLPVFRGELAGQDYPVGAISTAAATAVARQTHSSLISAEKLATAATLCINWPDQSEQISEAYEDALWYGEHTWGYHFPCGPAVKASEYEKTLHAYKSAALAHEVLNKAMAGIADAVKKEEDGLYLVVFNTLSFERTAPVRAPLREFDNIGSTMKTVPPEEDEKGAGYQKGVLLYVRWHVNPGLFVTEGKFDLVDVSTGEIVPFQILDIEDSSDTVPYAAERTGLGSGTKRLGLFEDPIGLKKDLCFIAKNVPPMGYKAYRLTPRTTRPVFKNSLMKASPFVIENEYYRVEVDERTGNVTSITDKTMARELVEQCSYGFFDMIVREKNSLEEHRTRCISVRKKAEGPVCASIEMKKTVYGHPAITSTVTLYEEIKQIRFDTRILKDAVPLLNAHIAFPFRMDNPKFRYEGVLSDMNPIEDYLPGSYSDTIAVQNAAKITDGRYSILWSSLDAPIVEFGGLWQGYTSPAHRCVCDESLKRPPLTTEDLKKGFIFSQVFNNNFGTNFYVSQTGDVLFRYCITTEEGDVSDAQGAAFGWQAVTGLEQIFTDSGKYGLLPPAFGFMEVDNDNAVILSYKKAEDGNGIIIRIWNKSDNEETVRIGLKYFRIRDVKRTSIAEIDLDERLKHDENSFTAVLPKNSVITVRAEGKPF
jgi:hypothetical protein